MEGYFRLISFILDIYLVVQSSKFSFADMSKKISLKEYATKHNKELNRRGHKMSESYLYRLIREDIRGIATRKLWFKYIFEGDKDRIFILL